MPDLPGRGQRTVPVDVVPQDGSTPNLQHPMKFQSEYMSSRQLQMDNPVLPVKDVQLDVEGCVVVPCGEQSVPLQPNVTQNIQNVLPPQDYPMKPTQHVLDDQTGSVEDSALQELYVGWRRK